MFNMKSIVLKPFVFIALLFILKNEGEQVLHIHRLRILALKHLWMENIAQKLYVYVCKWKK
jgi:hypothetical protein